MFIVLVHYTQPLDVIDQHLAAHRRFLGEGYEKNYFVVSGPQVPRTGGVIVSQLKDRDQLAAILQADPFALAGVAEYDIIEFQPVKHHVDFAVFM